MKEENKINKQFGKGKETPMTKLLDKIYIGKNEENEKENRLKT